jgi:hypothetical protein
MKTRLLLFATMCLVTLALQSSRALSKSDDVADAHSYTIRIDGRDGAELQMLLVAKPSAVNAPTREAKLVVLPYEATFNASSFFVWFDTLDGGQSGKDGDRIMGSYTTDGEIQGGGFDGTIKTNNHQSFGFGNL